MAGGAGAEAEGGWRWRGAGERRDGGVYRRHEPKQVCRGEGEAGGGVSGERAEKRAVPNGALRGAVFAWDLLLGSPHGVGNLSPGGLRLLAS